jgi:hypothetical protein
MQFLLLGLVALVVMLLLLRGFTRANVQVLTRQLRVAGGVLALGGAAILVVRGLAGYAAPLAGLGVWLLWGHGGIGTRATPSPQQASRIVTDTLEAELDHDTGELTGRVLRGGFAGRMLETLTPAELSDLWRDCRFADPPSARILEAWLARVHPTWEEDARRAGHAPQGHAAETSDGPMSKSEALDILGLAPGATADEIRRAHRELMLKMHPDKGGSTYLAAKINEAKDVLLDIS